VSNALKFSKNGGLVKISAKYINCVKDLTYQDEPKFIKNVIEA